jgi:hypothetical protein
LNPRRACTLNGFRDDACPDDESRRFLQVLQPLVPCATERATEKSGRSSSALGAHKCYHACTLCPSDELLVPSSTIVAVSLAVTLMDRGADLLEDGSLGSVLSLGELERERSAGELVPV